MSHSTLVVLSVAVIIAQSAAGYNISPAPNVIFGEPSDRGKIPKVRGSYFGLALHLSGDSVFVGAPRAQSTSRKQFTINEPGAIYRCSFGSGLCEQYLELEDRGTEHGVIKSEQYFGATLDGDEGTIVGCAPRMIGGSDDYRAMTGACYTRVNGTTRSQRQAFNYHTKSSAFVGALEGFAVHLVRTAAGEVVEVVTGMPGYNYTGSVMIYGGDLRLGTFLNTDHLQEHGYFGFSVSSMVVENETFYLVSAPRFNGEFGRVFVFKKLPKSPKKAEMEIINILYGDSLGDYFGYSLCTEDINGDGLIDIVVGAPFSSRNFVLDNGAVYVFINKGIASNGSLALERQEPLHGNTSTGGQFGYSISAIGDINQDGYNDIAVGAPFEGSGRVYVFHGSSGGISSRTAQILNGSKDDRVSWMFGAGISKGSDIDNNGYNDISVGAPLEDTVYVFKTYPIVRPKVNMTTSKTVIVIKDAIDHTEPIDVVRDNCDVVICYHLENYDRNASYDFRINLTFDSGLRRAKFENSSSYATTVQISQEESCFVLNLTIRASFYQLSSPVKLELNYAIINQNISTRTFCDHCVIQEQSPRQEFRVVRKLLFQPDCEKESCATDLNLRVRFRNFASPFILNSNRTLEIRYEVSNLGEAAYGTILEISFSQNVSFFKTPVFCEDAAGGLSCMINYGQPVRKGMVLLVNLTLDASSISEGMLQIEARLLSDGNDTVSDDNEVSSEIQIVRFSAVQMLGNYNPSSVSVDTVEKNILVGFKLNLDNFGPSNIERATVSLYIPLEYVDANISFPLLFWEESNLKIFYDDSELNWTQSEPLETLESDRSEAYIETYDSREQFLFDKKGSSIRCYDPSIICTNISFFLENFTTDKGHVQIEFDLQVFPQAIVHLMGNDLEKLTLDITFELNKPSREISRSTARRVVFYRTIPVAPIWIYVISAVLGLALLSAITYILHKRNFFKRMSQAEMEAWLYQANHNTDFARMGGSVMTINGERGIGPKEL
ncbi:integrin alpha-PS3-like [Toxorhynchites rutilus septentrionalis]|uniref:integrin alpha-PS3-like n=1 Tax=Toxorhynchites rutilus septentrionalis TaxID=329112 RepID=UPI00247A953B|nr:integrin alpha-PS3-like [Toxorhynchites rutilus septentrionalis]